MLIPQELQLSPKKTLTFLENFKFFQTKDFELSEKGNCLFHTKF